MAWHIQKGTQQAWERSWTPLAAGEHGDDVLPIHGGTVADGRCRDGARIDLANGIFD